MKMKIHGYCTLILGLVYQNGKADAFLSLPFKMNRRFNIQQLQSTKERESGTEASKRKIPSSTDCDDSNTPPSLSKVISSIHTLKSGSDIRGVFVDHPRRGSILNVSTILDTASEKAFTPLAAYCYGRAFAKMVQIRSGKGSATYVPNSDRKVKTNFDSWGDEFDLGLEQKQETVICVGRDPRDHGVRIADSLCRGIESVDSVKALYTGIASTPSMFEFCRSDQCDGGIIITASHLPEDRNGMKFFTKMGGLTNSDIEILADGAAACVREWYDIGIVPPSSGDGAVFCSSWVDYMPHYAKTLQNAIIREVSRGLPNSIQSKTPLPLSGLRIVLNAGNGSGFFFNEILKKLGADVSGSINLTPNGTFPPDAGVPNPEYDAMIQATIKACESSNADLGIMFDTDSDRSGFIVPRSVDGAHGSRSNYEALNRNRLIALLGVIFQTASPGCTFVTDSVTSEGLSTFLEDDLGLHHVRFLKGYANVIGKAKELTESGRALAEVGIETSGHCAMRENGYLDDGTYTAVKVIGLLARVSRSVSKSGDGCISLLDLISGLKEMSEVKELRMNVLDGTTSTTTEMFSQIVDHLEKACRHVRDWNLDTENLEGIRVRVGEDGSFFMIRKSLHDPVISLLVEGTSIESVRSEIIEPINDILKRELAPQLDLKCLDTY